VPNRKEKRWAKGNENKRKKRRDRKPHRRHGRCGECKALTCIGKRTPAIKPIATPTKAKINFLRRDIPFCDLCP
jgi:hypothetical protein